MLAQGVSGERLNARQHVTVAQGFAQRPDQSSRLPEV